MILVVDSNDDARRVTCKLLEAYGQTSKAVTTGGEAIRHALAFPCRAVVMEVTLPDMPGMVLLEFLKACPRTAPIPVVVYATDDDCATVARATELGAFAWVTKGRPPHQMVDAVRRAVALRT